MFTNEGIHTIFFLRYCGKQQIYVMHHYCENFSHVGINSDTQVLESHIALIKNQRQRYQFFTLLSHLHYIHQRKYHFTFSIKINLIILCPSVLLSMNRPRHFSSHSKSSKVRILYFFFQDKFYCNFIYMLF